MKGKILLLTTIYPAPDLKYGTPAVHYFTKEWVKMGYDVKVIHYQAVYPTIFYLLAKLFREKIASRTGAVVFTKKDRGDKHYMMDKVSIHRFPIFKWFPHFAFTKRIIKQQLAKIIQIIKRDDFVPDIIIGHFSNPQLEIISELKKIYTVRTCMVMHDKGDSIKKTYKQEYQKFMNSIDIWGYRSTPIQMGFEENFGKQGRSFLCYSGIPEKYISQMNNKNFSINLNSFVYVGDLIERKCPISLIYAIHSVYPDNKYHISYIGKGAEEIKMKAVINAYKINNKVSFIGHIPREEVRNILDESECMIMISKNETFGLVYLEAMGRGCITIGSKNQGIDGIIKNGINGFLCAEGDEIELAEIIKNINSLSSNERKQISQNAIDTVKELTDYKVAKKYITEVTY